MKEEYPMKEPSSAESGIQGPDLTLEEQKLVRFVFRRCNRWKGTDRGKAHVRLLWELFESDHAAQCRRFMLELIQNLEDGNDQAFEFLIDALEDDPDDTMLSVVSSIACGRIKRRGNSYTDYYSAPKNDRSVGQTSSRVRVLQSRPRERRPGGSTRRASRTVACQSAGDSSDPPGPEPAALAALFQFIYPFGGWTS